MSTTPQNTAFCKVIRPGTVSISARDVSVFYKIECDGKQLSITGVEGPYPSGNAAGACGQIRDSLTKLQNLADGWTPELVKRFARVWRRWHLNDMRASCEHQRDWDTTHKVEVVTYKLTSEARAEQRRIEIGAKSQLLRTGTARINDDERAALALPYTTTTAPDADSVGSGRYEVEKREQKALGWLRPDEHPDGLLTKPCAECGYKYGTEWRHEDIPEEVLTFLRVLPEADKTPAWV